ncbi:hypothetical protein B1R94_02290 [Mycolicibacterium litorale]|nr:hypothetical protein B1R94_02290 [Mycolicibacterium litorale]
MWPEPGEALDRTIEVEAAVADLYAEALRRWAPAARAAVLPALTAAAGEQLPPDPDALAGEQSSWDAIAATVILAGLGLLWAVTYTDAVEGLGIDLPDPPGDAPRPDIDPAVTAIIARTTDATTRQARDDLARATANPSSRDALGVFVDSHRDQVAAVPGMVREALTAAVQSLKVQATTTAVVIDSAQLRAETAQMLDAAGPAMRDLARREGYQAAGVMNHAVITAAQQDPDAGELQKCWIATLDGRTRPTHWAADGQRAPLGGKFTVGGEHLEFPGDPHASAAERKNCRCRVGVLAKDEALPDEVDRHTERLDGRDSVVINRDGRTQAEEIQRRADDGNIRARDDPEGIGRVASGGWTAPSEQEMGMTSVEPAVDEETYFTFTDALFAVTGVPTADGRMLDANLDLTMRETPLPVQFCEEMEGGHYGSVTVGVVEAIRFKNGQVRGDGYMLNNENALKAIDLVSHGVCNPSVDLGNCEIIPTDQGGILITEDTYAEDMEVLWTTVKAELLAVTLVAIPAFGETRIALNEQREPRAKALVASAVAEFTPRVYDPALFADPKLTGPTHLTITEDGRIFGHVACWSERHRSVGLGNITPPHSATGYENFHSSPPVRLADGSSLPVGRLTVGIGHAPTTGISNVAAQAHYDNPESCFALVRAGEDQFGIWVSGVPAPWATPEKVEMGLASPMSGDWRPYGRGLDLVAVLAVNTPGFLCRGGGTSAAAGDQLAMVASLGPSQRATAGGIGHLSFDDIRAAVRIELEESQRTAALAARRESALARARDVVGDPPTPAERLAALLERA